MVGDFLGGICLEIYREIYYDVTSISSELLYTLTLLPFWLPILTLVIAGVVQPANTIAAMLPYINFFISVIPCFVLKI